MRLLKSILKGIAILVALCIVLFLALMFIPFSQRSDAFVLKDAQLLDPQFLHDMNARATGVWGADREHFTVNAHRLAQGQGTIYSHREYSGGGTLIIDDESYRKITIWTRSVPPDRKTTLELGQAEQVIAVFAKGGSAWPDTGCAGYLNEGQVVIEPRGDPGTFQISVKAKLQPMERYDRLKRFCNEDSVTDRFRAEPIDFNQLDTWLGLAGAHPYRETYP